MKGQFQEYSRTLRPILDEALSQALRSIFQDLGTSVGKALQETLKGGKMIRGSLLCAVSEALGGTLLSGVPMAVAVELIHGATLVHDDFVDQHRTRRNRLAAWTSEGARKAVLFGDVVFASAIEMMSDLGRDEGLTVSRAIATISKGAFREPLDPGELAGLVESNRFDDQFYEAIIHLKTGVLFGAACELGAIAAGAENSMRKAFYRYGSLIGEAYQIADDRKEVRHHLRIQSIGPREMAALAPAVLYFGNELRSQVLAVLKEDHWLWEGPMSTGLRDVQRRMEDEIEKRLKLAVLQVSGFFSDPSQGEMIHQAPQDLIDMFNKS